MSTIIQLSDVTKRYGGRVILDQISLEVQAGETVALIGPSGGGKSTLLRCINALNDFDSGQIRVGTHDVPAVHGGRAGRAAARQVRRLLGMIFQDFQLFPHFTALENVVEAPLRVLRMKRAEAQALGLKLLARVGLSERTGHYPAQLSGGQKQRVAIARALAMSPRGLLCDEITSALDPELKNEVLDVLEGLKREGMTLLLVTHEIGFARRAADRVIVLADGKIIEDGPPGDVIDRPSSPRTQRFLRSVLG
ncbi:MAG: amino acid ABC transporter ATP-binding protein [Pirellulales bacterium]